MDTGALITAEQLLDMPDNRRCELLSGQLRQMTPPCCRHAAFVSRLNGLIGNYVEEHKLGIVLAGDPGFIVARDPDTVLAPDIAFIRAEALAAEPLGGGYREGAPDLAIEIRSQRDTVKSLHAKALAWLSAGAALVWLIDPARRTVTTYRTPTDIATLSPGSHLDGGDLLPGFRCPVAELFASH